MRGILLGGLLPILAYVLVEQVYGTIGGMIAGVVLGAVEVGWEYRRYGKVQGVTWLSSGLVLVLGGISLWEGEGVFFKLQPAIFLLVFALIFLVSSLLGRPFFVALAKKQNPGLHPFLEERFHGINWRLGFLFLALSALSAYSAFHWSTAAWAALKAVGLPAGVFAYMLIEVLWIRLFAKPPRQ